MSEMKKNLDYYKKLPYAVILQQDEDRDWIARIKELSGCIAHGSTPVEALENIEDVKSVWIEDALEAGDSVPGPRSQAELPSGKRLQRVPRSLHKKLADLAEEEDVSLNQFVTSILAEAVGARVLPVASARLVKPAKVFDPFQRAFQRRLLLHSPDELWVKSVIETRAKEAVWKISGWKVSEPRPRQVIDLNEMLKAGVGSLPNELGESDFKVNENVTKKEHAIKTYKA
jgi:predicted RNase H-like HicB family nuclease